MQNIQTISCYHRLIDNSLVSDIPRRHKVSVRLVTTLLALKCCLCFSIRFTDVATLRASPRGVSRVNKLYKNTFELSFILDKALQLIKSPISYFRSSRLISLNTISNPLKVFKFDRVTQAFSLF